MNDPIASIDAENIDRNANEAYKTMHKAIKQFQDLESKIGFELSFLENIIEKKI